MKTFMLRQSRHMPKLIAALAMLAPYAQANSPLLNEVVKARDLICEMRTSGTPPRDTPRNLMLFLENVEMQRARMVTSATIGTRPVRVYSGDTGVHFVEDVHASVKVTSILSCMRWNTSSKGRQCVRYEAVNRWHFDNSVHRNADQSYLSVAENSYTGWCEPWRID